MYNNLKVYKFSEQQLCIPSIDVDLGRGNSEYGIYDADADSGQAECNKF